MLLAMRGIRKAFEGVEVLHGTEFTLRCGEVHALVGENGAGKSTLMKILFGVYPDARGTILLDGVPVQFRSIRDAERAGISMIQQELNLIPELSVAENIFLGREPRRLGVAVAYGKMNTAAAELLRQLGSEIDPKWAVKDLRIGARQVVEIAKALSLSARVLVMDEPTSALSETEIVRLFEVIRRLAARGVGIVYISHRFEEIFDIADRVTVLRDGLHVDTMPVGDTSREGLIRLMVGRSPEQFFAPHAKPGSRVLFRAENLALARADYRPPRILDDITFEVRKGEILGVGGLMGAGRSELLEALFGVHGSRASGRILLEGRAVYFASPASAMQQGVALVTEDRKRTGLIPAMSVTHNLSLAALGNTLRCGFLSRRREHALVDPHVQRLAIQYRDGDQAVLSLSGGNQQKVVLGKWLARAPRVLLLDEPTRGIDVGAKAEIYRLLSELARDGCAIVMTSSELPELLYLCDRIMVLRAGRISACFDRGEATQERILDAAAPAGGARDKQGCNTWR